MQEIGVARGNTELQNQLNAVDSDPEDTDNPPEQVVKNLKSDLDTEDRKLSNTTSAKRQKSRGISIGSNIKSNCPNTNPKRKRYPSRESVSIHITYCDLIFAYINMHHFCLFSI